MIFPKILALVIIGGGYLIWNTILLQNKRNKKSVRKSSITLGFALAIILGQMYFIWFVFPRLFINEYSIPFFLLVIRSIISALILMSFWKKFRG